MGVFLKQQSENIEWIIWELTEDVDSLIKLLNEPDTIDILKSFRTEKRKKEFLCSRILLKELFNHFVTVNYDEYGSPYITDSEWNISITHSGKYVAVARSKQKLGIDIEQITEKLDRTKHKFSSDEELKRVDNKQPLYHLALYWSAKESVYKRVGNEALIFDTEMLIETFVLEEKGQFLLNLNSSLSKELVKLHYQKIDNYVFTYCV